MKTIETNNTKLFTRQQRLNNECTHEEYYSQFVNDTIKARVLQYISENKIKKAFESDKCLNSIPLSVWDSIALNLFDVSNKMKLVGDYLTLAGGVCIAKQAARMIINK